MNANLRRYHWFFAALYVAAALLAVVSARPYAASWNDGSRLAAIEAIVDYHTFVIDRSIYAGNADDAPADKQPFLEFLNANGTMDKIRINDHFYSDKPLLPSLALAGPYWVGQQLTGLRARERPDIFAYLMTLLGSGLPYLVAVAAVARTGRSLGLSQPLNLLLTASFAFATIAVVYTCHLNGHIMLLAVAALVFLLLADLSRCQAARPYGKLLLLGLLNGIGYAIEQPTGGLLLAGTGLVLLYRRPRFTTAFLYGLAVLPGMIGHQTIGYTLAGTLRPLNQFPEYFDYPGSEFDAKSMTGIWNHDDFGSFQLYAASLIFSDRGFLPSNLPLYLLLPGSVILLARIRAERPEMWLAGLWCAGVWLVFAALSTNYGGSCCSVRWFVPFLAAAYYLLALLLRERPDLAPDFVLLSVWGVFLVAEMWASGTWSFSYYSFWPIQALALLSWAAYRLWRWRATRVSLRLATTA